MRIKGKLRYIFLPVLILLCVWGAASAGQEKEERRTLLKQQKLLSSRIIELRKEQDFLLFQKTLYTSDSKYLIINLSKGTGQLRYKNRVLKDFRFSSRNTRRTRQGMVTLSTKIGTAKEPKQLVFGITLVLLPKGSPSPGDKTPALFLGKRDFRAVFFALENAARAYLLR
jgi:hypothetical protein